VDDLAVDTPLCQREPYLRLPVRIEALPFSLEPPVQPTALTTHDLWVARCPGTEYAMRIASLERAFDALLSVRKPLCRRTVEPRLPLDAAEVVVIQSALEGIAGLNAPLSVRMPGDHGAEHLSFEGDVLGAFQTLGVEIDNRTLRLQLGRETCDPHTKLGRARALRRACRAVELHRRRLPERTAHECCEPRHPNRCPELHDTPGVQSW